MIDVVATYAVWRDKPGMFHVRTGAATFQELTVEGVTRRLITEAVIPGVAMVTERMVKQFDSDMMPSCLTVEPWTITPQEIRDWYEAAHQEGNA